MGTRTDAALEAVVAARADLGDQVDRLEAAGRAAVDVPAKVRANPAKAAGVAAGGAFLAVGGPKRVFRRARRAITGKEEELPSELLPKDVEKALTQASAPTAGRSAARSSATSRSTSTTGQKERKKEGVSAAMTGPRRRRPCGPIALRRAASSSPSGCSIRTGRPSTSSSRRSATGAGQAADRRRRHRRRAGRRRRVAEGDASPQAPGTVRPATPGARRARRRGVAARGSARGSARLWPNVARGSPISGIVTSPWSAR